MGLLELWNENRQQLDDKRLHQLIAFAGDGRLLDGGATMTELRQLLAAAPSERLARWKDEAIEDRYDGFGCVLQDPKRQKFLETREFLCLPQMLPLK